MPATVALALLVLWLLGLLTPITRGGFIHGLRIIAVVASLFGFKQGRRP